MYAVVSNGGKQYRVKIGQLLKLEKLEKLPGELVLLDKVLLVGETDAEVQAGCPYLDKATVQAEVVRHGRAKKIRVIKFKRRKNYMKTQGHRQHFTEVKITKIAIDAKGKG